jgi:threonine dehydrogenase-like Zn-dependent dehydrogenase
MEQTVTLPTNFVTVFNTMWADLDLPTPWPKPEDYVPPRANDRILVWGASSSVGQYALQILRYYGYRNIIATSSSAHHAHLLTLGATKCYDYRSPTLTEDLMQDIVSEDKPAFPLIIDCIGSQPGSLTPLSRIATSGSTVAVMLPVILQHATDDVVPQYSMDARASMQWASGVEVRGVRTHFYARVSAKVAL